MTELFLSKPALRYKNSFLEAVREVQAERASNPFSATMAENHLDIDQLRDDFLFEGFLEKMERESLATTTDENGYVPNTTLWLIGRAADDTEVFIGRVNIRHYLTEKLRNTFGHSGFLIRPTERDKGYGRSLLQLALFKAKEIVTDAEKFDHKVLITCRANNAISQKIIIGAGGIFERSVILPSGESELLHWVPL